MQPHIYLANPSAGDQFALFGSILPRLILDSRDDTQYEALSCVVSKSVRYRTLAPMEVTRPLSVLARTVRQRTDAIANRA